MKAYFDNFKFKPVVVEDLLPYVLELDAGSEERSQWDDFLNGFEHKTVGRTILLGVSTHGLGHLPFVDRRVISTPFKSRSTFSSYNALFRPERRAR